METETDPTNTTSDPLATSGTAEANPDVTYPLGAAALTDEQVASAIAAINDLKAMLPPLPALTPLQRRRVPKMGSKTEGFVGAALASATKDRGVLPQSVSLESLRTQYRLRDQLGLLQAHLDDLTSKVDDARLLCGSWLYAVARAIYVLMKTSVGNTRMPGQQAELRKRFARKAKTDQSAQTEQVPA